MTELSFENQNEVKNKIFNFYFSRNLRIKFSNFLKVFIFFLIKRRTNEGKRIELVKAIFLTVYIDTELKSHSLKAR